MGSSGGFGDGHVAGLVLCGAIGRRLLARYLVFPRLFPLPARRGHQLLDLPGNRIQHPLLSDAVPASFTDLDHTPVTLPLFRHLQIVYRRLLSR